MTRTIELRTAIPGPRSQEILERKRRVVASSLPFLTDALIATPILSLTLLIFAAGTLVTAFESLPPGSHRLTLAYQGEGYQVGHADRVEASITLKIEEPDADYQRWEALMRDTLPPR